MNPVEFNWIYNSINLWFNCFIYLPVAQSCGVYEGSCNWIWVSKTITLVVSQIFFLTYTWWRQENIKETFTYTYTYIYIYRYVECTSSSIQALNQFRKLHPSYRRKEIDDFITNATNYIEDAQMPDGSWYGNWGICFIYGTWFAIKGLVAAGRNYYNCEAVRRGVHFLLKIQRQDGGWAESYISCPSKVLNCLIGYR